MKRSFKLFTVSLSVFAYGISICSCGNSNAEPQNVPVVDELDVKLRQIYSAGVNQGLITISYQEWLESIKGQDGDDGLTPYIGENGNWWIGSTDTNVRAEGKSAYELYCDAHPEYTGDLNQWLDDLTNGRLGDKEYHTVTFDSNGGSEVEPQQVLHGEKATKPIDPTKERYTFEGWYDENDDRWVFNGYSITFDITLYAKWKVIPELTISPTSVTIKEGESFIISVETFPEDAEVIFTSDDEKIATVDKDGNVYGVSMGTTTIDVSLSEYGISEKCAISVEYDLDIWTKETNMSGSLTVGVPAYALEFTTQMAEDYNEITDSDVEFNFVEFNEYDSVNNFPSGPSSGPDVFPFTYDDTYNLYQLGALSPLPQSDISDYCTSEMLKGSLVGATINNNYFGYPYAADEGVVMFYNKELVSNPWEIHSLDGLYNKAKELNLKVAFDLCNNGLYGSGLLHTFSMGEPLYKVDYTNTGRQITTSFTNSDGGAAFGAMIGMELLKSGQIIASNQAPIGNDCFASIISTRYVRQFKNEMGSNYGVMPVPSIVDNTDGTSPLIGTHIGNKYFGVNGLLEDDKLELARNFARFLSSEYAQYHRYYALSTQPTFSSLQKFVANEPHIAALNEQKESNCVIITESLPGQYYYYVSLFFQKLFNSYQSAGEYDIAAGLEELDMLLK